MLLRWRCVFTSKMLKMLLCWKKGMCIWPMVLWGIMTFLWDPWKHWNSISTQFYWFLRKQHKMKNLNNLKLVKTADNMPQGMLSTCWSRSMCYHVPCRPQNAVKRSEQMSFLNLSPAPVQLRSGEPQASSLYIYSIHVINFVSIRHWPSYHMGVLHRLPIGMPPLNRWLGFV